MEIKVPIENLTMDQVIYAHIRADDTDLERYLFDKYSSLITLTEYSKLYLKYIRFEEELRRFIRSNEDCIDPNHSLFEALRIVTSYEGQILQIIRISPLIVTISSKSMFFHFHKTILHVKQMMNEFSKEILKQ